jgi:hypothetical protein
MDPTDSDPQHWQELYILQYTYSTPYLRLVFGLFLLLPPHLKCSKNKKEQNKKANLISDQIQNRQNCYTTPNKNLGGEAHRQTPGAKSLYRSIF